VLHAVTRPAEGQWRSRAQAIFACLLFATTIFVVGRYFQDALFHNAWIHQTSIGLPKFFRDFEKERAPTVFEEEMAMSPRELLDRWNPLVEQASKKFGIPQSWIRAVMSRESGGRTMMGEGHPITSSTGALGLMQLMPETYAEMSQQYGLGANALKAQDNIIAGTAYLSWLKHRYGFPAMFAAYNDGPGNFEKYLAKGRQLPAETVAYLKALTRKLSVKG
jgi:hypothetical protein